MKFIPPVLAASLLALAALATQASQIVVNGRIAEDNDVVRVGFHLDDDSLNVKLWTNSFKHGLNFDPAIALWSLATGNLIDSNDDNPFIHKGQTLYDAGLWLDSLAAGDYLVTLTTSGNAPVSDRLGDGFQLDHAAAMPLSDVGGHYSLHFKGVDGVTPMPSPVPEPTPLALLAAGLGVVAWVSRRATLRPGAA